MYTLRRGTIAVDDRRYRYCFIGERGTESRSAAPVRRKRAADNFRFPLSTFFPELSSLLRARITKRSRVCQTARRKGKLMSRAYRQCGGLRDVRYYQIQLDPPGCHLRSRKALDLARYISGKYRSSLDTRRSPSSRSLCLFTVLAPHEGFRWAGGAEGEEKDR